MNTLTASFRNTQSTPNRWSSPLTLLAVVAAHVLGLVWAAQHVQITPPSVTPPSVAGVLVAPEPKPVPPPPQPVQAPPPPPKPAPKPRPEPKPTPKPAAKPAPEPPPAPTTTAQPTPTAPVQTAKPVPESPAAPTAPTAPTAPAAPAPVTPPRTDAAHLNNPAPQYPALSRRLGEQGRVLLDVYILPDGSVGDIKLNTSSGHARLDNAALAAVKTWKYVPARRGDQAIAFWYVQPVSFVLNN
ncbi:energy transducer TonB [Limnobacter sp.]|uniref:energy transducer TonB n=1 Tax=Limnobacter sp. TaxID=2003368 RepID=UPI003518E47F